MLFLFYLLLTVTARYVTATKSVPKSIVDVTITSCSDRTYKTGASCTPSSCDVDDDVTTLKIVIIYDVTLKEYVTYCPDLSSTLGIATGSPQTGIHSSTTTLPVIHASTTPTKTFALSYSTSTRSASARSTVAVPSSTSLSSSSFLSVIPSLSSEIPGSSSSSISSSCSSSVISSAIVSSSSVPVSTSFSVSESSSTTAASPSVFLSSTSSSILISSTSLSPEFVSLSSVSSTSMVPSLTASPESSVKLRTSVGTTVRTFSDRVVIESTTTIDMACTEDKSSSVSSSSTKIFASTTSSTSESVPAPSSSSAVTSSTDVFCSNPAISCSSSIVTNPTVSSAHVVPSSVSSPAVSSSVATSSSSEVSSLSSSESSMFVPPTSFPPALTTTTAMTVVTTCTSADATLLSTKETTTVQTLVITTRPLSDTTGGVTSTFTSSSSETECTNRASVVTTLKQHASSPVLERPIASTTSNEALTVESSLSTPSSTLPPLSIAPTEYSSFPQMESETHSVPAAVKSSSYSSEESTVPESTPESLVPETTSDVIRTTVSLYVTTVTSAGLTVVLTTYETISLTSSVPGEDESCRLTASVCPLITSVFSTTSADDISTTAIQKHVRPSAPEETPVWGAATPPNHTLTTSRVLSSFIASSSTTGIFSNSTISPFGASGNHQSSSGVALALMMVLLCLRV